MEKEYLVVNSQFNRNNCPDLIGQIFTSPPGYCQLEVIHRQHDNHCMAYANFLWEQLISDENEGIDAAEELYIYDVK